VQIAAGHHSAALTKKGEIFVWGSGVFGEYLTANRFSKIDSAFTSISIGANFGRDNNKQNNIFSKLPFIGCSVNKVRRHYF